ncbi:helix-turn-helix domain-containing protein [Bradyrhizobium sp. CCGUVB4N]|uniref:helix-turn-helix domain-containing protein n=1 Tax=Bradyrhizobium sp. CCGUVB4N TaxID=2949631 RepID=UPI0020B1DC77|nr:helix-turn-helix transcriptional regulator [Bradyrhizobium sp. CCGUVB4N]MCP3385970.1 helix-turn-helix domain-containing protein [Bradyrhizobium sp. CCGUVB4N]
MKAARALLDWSQQQAAEDADVSLTALRSIEMGFAARESTMVAIRTAFENAGLEFLEGDGVRRRNDMIKIYQGHDSCDRFFAELQTKCSEVIACISSRNVLAQPCGKPLQTNLERLEQLRDTTSVKCLLPESAPPSLFMSSLDMRAMPDAHFGAVSYIVFGDKYAEIVADSARGFVIVVFSIAPLARSYRQQFLAHWNAAKALQRRAASYDAGIAAAV